MMTGLYMVIIGLLGGLGYFIEENYFKKKKKIEDDLTDRIFRIGLWMFMFTGIIGLIIIIGNLLFMITKIG